MSTERVTELLYNKTGQTFSTIPSEWSEGAPSAASCSVFAYSADGNSTAEFSPSVTVEAISTTLVLADAGYSETNRRQVTLASASGVKVGSQYLLTNARGQRELATPIAVTADVNGAVDLDADLAYDYPIGTSTFVGVKLSATVDSTWVASSGKITVPGAPPWRVVWTYTINSIVRRQFTYLRLVPQYSKHTVTLADLRRVYGDLNLQQEASLRGDGFRGLIDYAWSEFRSDVVTAGYEVDQIRDTELLNLAVVKKTLMLLAQKGMLPSSRPRDVLAKEYREDYEKFFAKVIGAVLRVDVDSSGTTGAIDPAPFQQPWLTR